MSTCTFFCFFGVAQLCCNGSLLRRAGAPLPAQDAEKELPAHDVDDKQGTPESVAEDGKVAASSAAGGCTRSRVSIALVLFALFLRYASLSLARTLWPLYLKRRFGWGDGASLAHLRTCPRRLRNPRTRGIQEPAQPLR